MGVRDFSDAPPTKVKINAFTMARHPTTRGEYEVYGNETNGIRHRIIIESTDIQFSLWSPKGVNVDQWAKGKEAYYESLGFRAEMFKEELEDILDLPMNQGEKDRPVHPNWFEAMAYAHYERGKLPTEAQWERAARGETGKDVDMDPKLIVCYENQEEGFRGTRSVLDKAAQKRTNSLDLVDMLGNTWEWTLGRYGEEDYRKIKEDKPDPYFPVTDLSRQCPVLRGASWSDVLENARAAYRDLSLAAFRLDGGGFRVVWPQGS